jgi:signal transduction histidine kinase
VDTRITHSNGRLVLNIQDDGKGIPSDAMETTPNGRQGVGLSTMRERNALLGGTFDVKTNSLGTLIVSVPVLIPNKAPFFLAWASQRDIIARR